MQSRVSGWWRWCAGLVVVAFLAWTPRASAQMMGDAGGAAMMQVNKRSLDSYTAILGLDAAQHESAAALLEAYRSEVARATKAFSDKQQAAMQEARDEGDFSSMTKVMIAEGMKLRDTMTAAEKQFFDDLKSLCTPDQASKWERVTRARRREQLMRIGMVSGAGVDLIALTGRAKVTPTNKAEYDALMEQYEIEVDRRLGEMKRVQDDMQAKQAEQFKDGFDMAKMQEMMAKVKEMLQPAVDIAKGVRELNRDFVRKLGEQVSEADRATLEREFLARAFPRVYKPSHVTKQLEAATGFTDLSPEQREQVVQMRVQYASASVPLNAKWAQAIQEQEDKNGGTFGVMSTMWMGGGEGADAVKDARKARRELDDSTAEKLRGLLSDAQKERLPAKAEEPFNPMADFMNPEDSE